MRLSLGSLNPCIRVLAESVVGSGNSVFYRENTSSCDIALCNLAGHIVSI